MASNYLKDLILTQGIGVPIRQDEIPVDGFVGAASHQNVASPIFNMGYAVSYYDPISGGYSVLMYCVAAEIALSAAAGQLYVQSGTTATPYALEDDNSTPNILGGLCAFSVTAMTADYYGFFWVGGMCPIEKSDLTTTTAITTDGDAIEIGTAFAIADKAAGYEIIKSAPGTNVPFGYAIAADA